MDVKMYSGQMCVFFLHGCHDELIERSNGGERDRLLVMMMSDVGDVFFPP
jgi:hypothetical protein